MMNLPSEITICEVGLRDGLQNEKTIVSTEDKLSLLRDLVDAWLPRDRGRSFMHPKKVPQMADTDDLFKALVRIPRRGVPRSDPQSAGRPARRGLRLQKGEAECLRQP